jgi:hypothetical protein
LYNSSCFWVYMIFYIQPMGPQVRIL